MRRHPRMARTDPSAPSGWATCQKSGFVGNAKNLHMQTEWRGLEDHAYGHPCLCSVHR